MKAETKGTRDRMRSVPHYWWDFKWVDDAMTSIIIETDDPRVPSGVLHEIMLDPKKEFADDEIKEAMKIIDDYQAGRRSYRK